MSDPTPAQETPARKKQLTPIQRAEICVLKRVNGWGAKRIHKAFPHIPKSTIGYTLKMESKRTDHARITGSGGQFKLTKEERQRLYAAIEENPSITVKDQLSLIDNKLSRNGLYKMLQNKKLSKKRMTPISTPSASPPCPQPSSMT
ncbi:hypothetical protein N7495_005096 [Penicillium taxi]|uniref:uncharacterized protein n=1 Tax=Penicillium taxi TaxID=168475 RepID=UPI0025459D42|nr:uncharacterized protein N7495_005096 [Penicillium taxi]KAJ5893405.1 hypothetical protein N7495_005096 [Penicillium taxi]